MSKEAHTVGGGVSGSTVSVSQSTNVKEDSVNISELGEMHGTESSRGGKHGIALKLRTVLEKEMW